MKSRIMLVGPVGVGKTSLVKALVNDSGRAEKTQSIQFIDGAIDTPGEYAQIPRFYSALMVTAAEAQMILLVQDATEMNVSLPPGFAGMFPRPIVGIVSKIDSPSANRERAMRRLREAGVRDRIFCVSAYTGEGLNELMDYLEEGGAKV